MSGYHKHTIQQKKKRVREKDKKESGKQIGRRLTKKKGGRTVDNQSAAAFGCNKSRFGSN